MSLIHFNAGPLRLLPQGAAFDPESGALFVADLHLGKTGIFRESGLSVPDGPDATLLQRLAALVEVARPAALVVLGDVFHACGRHMEKVVEALHLWRAKHPALPWKIVPGNHDRAVPWSRWLPGAEILSEGQKTGPWTLAHHPPEHSELPVLCGHLHPGITIGPARGPKLRMACFWMRRGVLVLPAFGEFTGLKLIQREAGDRLWVPVQGRVVEVPNALSRRQPGAL